MKWNESTQQRRNDLLSDEWSSCIWWEWVIAVAMSHFIHHFNGFITCVQLNCFIHGSEVIEKNETEREWM